MRYDTIVTVHTGEKQQLSTSSSSLNGGLHQRRKSQLIALIDTNSPEMMQQKIDHVVVT